MRVAVLKNNVPIDKVLVETPDESERYEIYVGRAEDCHVRIDDPLISRHHLVIFNDHSGWSCEKLTKLGIMTVNGKDSGKVSLHNGDEIKCGIYSLLISEIDGDHTTPHTRDYRPAHTSIHDPSLTAPINILPRTTDTGHAPHVSTQDEQSLGLDPLNPSELQNDQLDLDPVNDDLDQELLTQDEIGRDFQAVSDSSEEKNQDGETSFEDNNEEVAHDEFGISALEPEERTRVDQSFVHYELKLFGEHAPYDRYVINQNETFIGRDIKKCQIILTDPEVSSVHSVVRRNGSVIILEDLNSSNGTILNGERINRSAIMPGDEFVIGSTSFTLEVKSDLLNAERDRLMPVEQGQIIETEEIEEELVDSNEESSAFDSNAPVEKSLLKRLWKNPVHRKRMMIVGGLALMGLILYEPEPEVQQAPNKPAVVQMPNQKPKLNLSQELQNKRNVAYELGVSFFEQSRFNEALREFETVVSIDSEYKRVTSYLSETKAGIKRLEELEAERRAEEERIKTKKIIDELLAKAREAVKDHKVQVAESYFSQITEKDPENIEVAQLKLELEAWQKEEDRKTQELAAKIESRKRMVGALTPGKTLYLKKEWYKATLKLDDFLSKQGMDEDLVKEASDMLSDAKNELNSELGPVIGKARSLKEGQDLKAAYESFLEVLKLEPTNAEALNEVDEIKNLLENRSKKIYREAIIAESLSLFNDAKEKFQEVQQISPSDSDYYKKATEKLRNYLE